MHVYSLMMREYADEPGRLRMMLDAIVETVGASFVADTKPINGVIDTDRVKMPLEEIKRRTEMCAKWMMILRRDYKWATHRVLDELPKALRCELDGIPYTPTREGRATWAADNARDLIWLPG